MKKSLKKTLAVLLVTVMLLGTFAVAGQATFLIIGAVPTFMWLTPLGLLAPVIWIAHKVFSLLAIFTPPVLDLPFVLIAVFIRVVLYPLWGILW